MATLRVAACQLNTTVGDLHGNVELIISALRQAEDSGCDIAVFPELAVSGYPPEDLLLKAAFVDEVQAALQLVAAATGDCVAIVGFVDGEKASANRTSRAFNAVALCASGEVHGVYHKRALPDYGVFDEQRYFSPGSHDLDLFRIRGVNVGVTICEDLWVPSGPIAELSMRGAQLILNVNASPFEQGKIEKRDDQIRERISESGVPIVYVNQVGAQDELVFDGLSMAFDARGELLARAPQFEEAALIFDIEALAEKADAASAIEIISGPAVARPRIESPVASLREPLEQLWSAIVLGTRDYVRKNGFTDICLGLSGGIDSSVVATIAVDALGPEHVHTVALPSRFSSKSSLDDAAELTSVLGCDHRVIHIEPVHASMLEILAPSFAGQDEDVTEENLQSRLRGVVLMGLANKYGWLVLTTGNKSETSVGYSTLYGDTAGAFAVIKDVWKLTVYDLCRWRNDKAGYDIVPASVLAKNPSAELRPNQRDDQSLPPYEILDPILRDLVENDLTARQIVEMGGGDEDVVYGIARMVDISEYKRRQNPIGPKVSAKAFGRDRRIPITNRYWGIDDQAVSWRK